MTYEELKKTDIEDLLQLLDDVNYKKVYTTTSGTEVKKTENELWKKLQLLL